MAASSAPSASPRDRIAGLDGLRAVAVLLVMADHLITTMGYGSPNGANAFVAAGYGGVCVFFVISGFLITSLLLRERRASGRIDVGNFYMRRVLRIFPVFYGYILVLVLARSTGLLHFAWIALVAPATFSRDFWGHSWVTAHFWSLSVEEQYYLFWPAMLSYLGESGALKVASTMLLAGPAIYVVVWHLGAPPLANWIVPEQFIAAGCVLALFGDRLRARVLYRALLTGWGVAFTGLLAGALILLAKGAGSTGGDLDIVALAAAACALLPFLDGCMVLSLRGGLLNWKALVWVGTLSYSLYVWQQLFFRPSGVHRLPFPFDLAAAVVAAVASSYLIERPFLRLRSRLRARVASAV